RWLAHELKVEPSARDDWYRHWVELGFRSLEAQLQSPATGRCCHGDAPGLADCCLVPQVYNARRYDVDLSAFPTIERIAAHCESLPAFQAARPDAQPDAE
ncbi:MAG: maleylacetoacetate isomerase, partial [Castellaniella sp.]